MAKGFVTLADGNTATLGSPVRIIKESWYHGVKFPPGYLFTVEGVQGNNLGFTFQGKVVTVAGANCVVGW